VAISVVPLAYCNNFYDRSSLYQTGEAAGGVFHRVGKGRPLRAIFRILALSDVGAYSKSTVKQPRNNEKLPIEAALQRGIDRSAELWRRVASGEIRVPKGIFRFKTHEEADEWWNIVLSGGQPPKK
jgi:hypothetical protein